MKHLKSLLKNISKKIASLLILLINTYQLFISPIFKPSCRFTPTCSQYAKAALLKYGPIKGAFLFLVRFLKCNPFFEAKYDPIPTLYIKGKLK